VETSTIVYLLQSNAHAIKICLTFFIVLYIVGRLGGRSEQP
jgi:hypothetical protein